MNNIARKLEIFVIVVIIAFIGIIYAFKQHTVLAPTIGLDQSRRDVGTPTETSAQVPTTVITYQGQTGQTALAILQAGHRVDVKHYSFGDMVTGIDGIMPDAQHFWSFYVNGTMSQVGASSYVTKSSDQIRWQIDTISGSNQ